MSSDLRLDDLPKEKVESLKLTIKMNHFLFCYPEELFAGASRKIGLSVEQTRAMAPDLYKKVFDEFLLEIQEAK